MQILIAAIIVLSLWSAEIGSPLGDQESIGNPLMCFLITWGTALLVPVLTLCFRVVLNRVSSALTLSDVQTRVGFFQTGIWLTGCAIIILFGHWAPLVKHEWDLEQYFLIDEIVAISPILFSLVASWIAMFDGGVLRQAAHLDNDSPSIRMFKVNAPLVQFCKLRCQVFLAMPLIPMVILWAAGDMSELCFRGSEAARWAIMATAFVCAILGFPWFLRFLWPNHRLEDENLIKKIQAICTEKKVKISDVRIWETNGKISNAMVTGFFWPLRMIWLSDGLLRMLEPDEIETVIRHEVGHAKRNHLALRILMLALPFVAAFVVILCFPNRLATWTARSVDLGVSIEWVTWVVIPTIGICYLFWALSWFSHRIEKDADIEACLVEGATEIHLHSAGDTASGNPSKNSWVVDPGRVESFKSALVKISGNTRGGIEKQTLMHPSILDRAQFLTRVTENDLHIVKLRRQMLTASLLVGLTIVSFVTGFFFL